jgi:hypothetical protein
MSDRNNESAHTTLGHIRQMVLRAEQIRHTTGENLSAWAIYSAAAGMASGALYLEGLEAKVTGDLIVAAAQCYELAKTPRMAARYAQKGLALQTLSAKDSGTMRAILDKAMVAA